MDQLLCDRGVEGGGGDSGDGRSGGDEREALLSRPCMSEKEKARLLQQYDCTEEEEGKYPHAHTTIIATYPYYYTHRQYNAIFSYLLVSLTTTSAI